MRIQKLQFHEVYGPITHGYSGRNGDNRTIGLDVLRTNTIHCMRQGQFRMLLKQGRECRWESTERGILVEKPLGK